MPLLDKPLDELHRYAGLNPRPADFDAYWDRALAELDATPPHAELLPNGELSTRHVACFDLWFRSVGGARVYAKYLRPRETGGARLPALVQFHGYGGSSGDWVSKCGWAAEGFALAILDARGQGGLSEDNLTVQGSTVRGHIVRGVADPDPDRLLFRSVYLDTVQLARVVAARPEVDPERIGAFGASQGGGLTLACAALCPLIKRAAPVFPFLCDYRRVWEMDLCKDAYEEIRYWLRQFDPRHERIESFFTRLGYIDCQHLAPRIRARTLMFTGLMDAVCPPSAQFAAFNKIPAPKEVVVYPNHGHETLPGEWDRIFNFMREL